MITQERGSQPGETPLHAALREIATADERIAAHIAVTADLGESTWHAREDVATLGKITDLVLPYKVTPRDRTSWPRVSAVDLIETRRPGILNTFFEAVRGQEAAGAVLVTYAFAREAMRVGSLPRLGKQVLDGIPPTEDGLYSLEDLFAAGMPAERGEGRIATPGMPLTEVVAIVFGDGPSK